MQKIIVTNLNKLRWLYPNQTFSTNILTPKTQQEFNHIINILTTNSISYILK